MSNYEENTPNNKQSVFGVIIHSFFVIPFLLAIFSVLLFMSVRILTMENKNIYDYLEDIKVGGISKRWQSAFELSKILGNPELVPKDERFVTEMISSFRKADHDDERVKQYLALAMGRTGLSEFEDPLLENIKNEKDENLIAIIYSLGILKSKKAVPVLLEYLNDTDPRIRLTTVTALGNIGNKEVVTQLKPLLNDTEPNIVWETAVALAQLEDASGAGILTKLLDREYLSQYPNVDVQEQTHVMLVALEAGANLQNADIQERTKTLARSDRNMKVRRKAFDIIKNTIEPN